MTVFIVSEDEHVLYDLWDLILDRRMAENTKRHCQKLKNQVCMLVLLPVSEFLTLLQNSLILLDAVNRTLSTPWSAELAAMTVDLLVSLFYDLVGFLDANSVPGCHAGHRDIGVSINYIKSTYGRISGALSILWMKNKSLCPST